MDIKLPKMGTGIYFLTSCFTFTILFPDVDSQVRDIPKLKMFPVSGSGKAGGDGDGASGPSGPAETLISGGYETYSEGHRYMVTLQVKIDEHPRQHSEWLEDYESSTGGQCNDTWLQEGPDWFHFCGGALLYNDLVLTAAHCVHKLQDSLGDIRVGIGWWDLSEGVNGTGHELRGVRNITIHPGWASESKRDLAILQLDRPTDHKCIYGTTCLKICTGRRCISEGYCHLDGWGQTQCGYPNILQETDVLFLRKRRCAFMWRLYGDLSYGDPDKYPVFKSEVCTLGWQYWGESDACTGDGGGVLVCDGKAAGVLSWWDARCKGCRPQVFATADKSWVLDTMKMLKGKTDSG